MSAIDLNKSLEDDPDSMILYRTHSPHEVEVDGNFDSTLLTAFAATGGLLIGYDFGCINGLMRSRFFIDVVEGQGKASISQSNVAIVMSLLFCGGLAGAIGGGSLGDRLGRRWLIQLSNAIYVLGVSLQMALDLQKPAFSMILISRFIVGLGMGVNLVGTLLYMTETVSPLPF
jgi:MFS family permease